MQSLVVGLKSILELVKSKINLKYIFLEWCTRNRKCIKEGKKHEVSSSVHLIKVPEGENRMREKQYRRKKRLRFSLTVEMPESSSSKGIINSEQEKRSHT